MAIINYGTYYKHKDKKLVHASENTKDHSCNGAAEVKKKIDMPQRPKSFDELKKHWQEDTRK